MRSLSLTAVLAAALFAGVIAGQSVHQRWLDENVVYMITPAERQAFEQPNSDAERGSLSSSSGPAAIRRQARP